MKPTTKKKVVNILAILFVALLAIIVAFPIFWMIRSSLVSKMEFFRRPPVIWPSKMLFSNFTKAMERIDFSRQLFNSISIVVPYVLGSVITCSLSAYAFARLKFPFKNVWFICIISTMMLPSAVTLIPQYLMYTSFGMVGVDSMFGGKLPLILPAFLCAGGNAYFLFLLRQFFISIPKDLDEAAKIDGAGHFRIYSQIMLPLIKPAVIVVALFSFINCWNEFFNTLIYLQGEKSYTLTLGLYIVNGMRISNYEQVMALAIIVSAPCLVFFLIGNKYFVEGITFSGLKG
ncbi:carbohydrate ABC transporter permease [Anaeromicropila herbilytica]|uniref:Sugar ABC transporter permease n=1 Tax=Anaeromicropila herbilytica TaxID=2785025 RepID=A0A7R7EKC7_9FIRM|nr:carbohydrate ABC transporter permease [Anaeromicropila herbilytica]BCN30062.1 sugar ABC transporter permease [Anaeromicropila herbilytica]